MSYPHRAFPPSVSLSRMTFSTLTTYSTRPQDSNPALTARDQLSPGVTIGHHTKQFHFQHRKSHHENWHRAPVPVQSDLHGLRICVCDRDPRNVGSSVQGFAKRLPVMDFDMSLHFLVIPASKILSSDIGYNKRRHRTRGVVSGSRPLSLFTFVRRFLSEEYDIRGQLERCEIIIDNAATRADSGLVLIFWFLTQTSAGRLTGQPEASKLIRLAKNYPRLSFQLFTFADSCNVSNPATNNTLSRYNGESVTTGHRLRTDEQ